MWQLKQSGQFKKDLRKYQNDRDAKGSFRFASHYRIVSITDYLCIIWNLSQTE